MLLTWINSTITVERFQHVYDPLGVATARQTWDSITRFFIDQAAARQMQLKWDLQNLRKDDLSMSDYVQTIKGLRDSIHAVGYTMSDHDLVMKVFDGLPLEYDSIFHPLLGLWSPSADKIIGIKSRSQSFIQDKDRS